MAVGFE